jgi:hypothetical protein
LFLNALEMNAAAVTAPTSVLEQMKLDNWIVRLVSDAAAVCRGGRKRGGNSGLQKI